jgi:hypothetical protein
MQLGQRTVQKYLKQTGTEVHGDEVPSKLREFIVCSGMGHQVSFWSIRLPRGEEMALSWLDDLVGGCEK